MLVYPRKIDCFLKSFLEADYEGWNTRVDNYLLNATTDEKEFILKFVNDLSDIIDEHKLNYHNNMEKLLEKYSECEGFVNSYLYNTLKNTDYSKLETKTKQFNECVLVLEQCYNKINERE